ncbi:hypothetical protein THAOC_03644, partial [Thalassiosira oceanica]
WAQTKVEIFALLAKSRSWAIGRGKSPGKVVPIFATDKLMARLCGDLVTMRLAMRVSFTLSIQISSELGRSVASSDPNNRHDAPFYSSTSVHGG